VHLGLVKEKTSSSIFFISVFVSARKVFLLCVDLNFFSTQAAGLDANFSQERSTYPLAIILKFGREEARFFNSHKLFIFFFRPWWKLLLQLSNLEITIFLLISRTVRCLPPSTLALSLRANNRANIFPH
jgi:hypothetical protein